MNPKFKVRFEQRPEGAATMAPDLVNAKNYYRWALSAMRPYFGKKILDIGGGFGSHVEAIIHAGYSVRSIDLSQASVEFMRNRFSDYPNFSAKTVDFGSDAGQNELIAENFDTITCMNVLEHIEDDQAALGLMYTILARQHGTLILQVPAHPWLYGSLDELAGHYRRYSLPYLRSVLSGAGFTIEKLYFFNSFGVLPWFLNARVFKRTLDAPSVGLQLRIFDNYLVPILQQIERIMPVPIGQSLMAVAHALPSS